MIYFLFDRISHITRIIFSYLSSFRLYFERYEKHVTKSFTVVYIFKRRKGAIVIVKTFMIVQCDIKLRRVHLKTS